MSHRLVNSLACRWALIGVLLAAPGCQAPLTVRGQSNGFTTAAKPQPGVIPWVPAVPTEKDKTTLPTYIIEPPDILLIDVVKLVPKAPYHIEPLDVMQINAIGTLLEEPISGEYPVDPSGNVDLGPSYKKVHVAGLTADEAREVILDQLGKILKIENVDLSVGLSRTAGQQNVTDEHIVGPDGTVNLGSYGSVYVAGMTIAEAKEAIEQQLSKFLEKPKVSVSIFAFNSKVYYVITEGAGQGDTVVRVPVTGNETVLDALAQVNGLSRLSSKNIWIARPAPGGVKCDQILPVNWNEITKGAATATNYQVLPNDRLFIAENKLLALDNWFDQVTSPAERLFGTSLLGTQAIQTFNRFPKGFSTGAGGGA